MKITFEHYDNKFTAEIPEDSNILSVFDHVLNIIRSCGFSEQAVKDVVIETAESFSDKPI